MKIAMVGTGGIAARHLEVLKTFPFVEIVAHVSRTQEKAGAAAAKWGGRAYTNIDVMLNAEELDAAWICTIPGAHGDIEQSLIENNSPFFVEKPLDSDGHAARHILRELDRKGLMAGVGYQWRAMDTLREVKNIISLKPPAMVIGSWLTKMPAPRWWGRKEESGGQMVEQATHLFDLARYLIGDAEVASSLATRTAHPNRPEADVAGASTASLLFDNGAIGVFNATCVLGKSESVNLTLVCDGVLITIKQTEVILSTADGARAIQSSTDAVANQDLAFLNAVREGDSSLMYCSYADAFETHKLCLSVARKSERSAVLSL
jgi:myo-inositol 2-dehydrogenase / D-chiro-inositol 1-dehydrogenase